MVRKNMAQCIVTHRGRYMWNIEIFIVGGDNFDGIMNIRKITAPWLSRDFFLRYFPRFLLDIRRNSICSNKANIDNLWYNNKPSVYICTRYLSLSIISPNSLHAPCPKNLLLSFLSFFSSANTSFLS